MTPYTLYVMSNSPYSDKIRMYLRLKRLPVVEVRENLRNREQVLRARTGKTIGELRTAIDAITGPLVMLDDGVPATPEMRVAVPRRLEATPLTHVGPYPVTGVSHLDGTKILLENDNWALLRFSGTEPVLRMTVEADDEAKAREMLDWLRGFATAGH